MDYKDYEQANDFSQNINDTSKDREVSTPEQDTSSLLSEESTNDFYETEVVSQLSDEEQAILDEKRSSPDFQKGLLDLLPKSSPPTAPVIDEEALQAYLQEWKKDLPSVQEEQGNLTTGLPEPLKSSIEKFSKISMDDVVVHYNSAKPKEINADAFAEDDHIYLAPGKVEHLPQEAWHVVQQKRKTIAATKVVNDQPINDQASEEKDARLMGEKADKATNVTPLEQEQLTSRSSKKGVAQRQITSPGNANIWTDIVALLGDMTEEEQKKTHLLHSTDTITDVESAADFLANLQRGDYNGAVQTVLGDKFGGQAIGEIPLAACKFEEEAIVAENEVVDERLVTLLTHFSNSWGLAQDSEAFIARVAALEIEIISAYPNGNCHGYSLNNADEFIGAGSYFVDNWVTCGSPNIIVYIGEGRIGHSAKITGAGRITQTFSNGIPLFSCNQAPFTEYAGYSNDYTLPDDRVALNDFLAPQRIKNELDTAYTTICEGLEDSADFYNAHYDQMDEIDTLQSEAEKVAAWQALLTAYQRDYSHLL